MKSRSKVQPYDRSLIQSQVYSVRKKFRDIIDGKIVTIFMAIVTIWVLFGDDIRLITTQKSADEGFFISFTICLGLFTIQLVLNSLFVQEYKFSFFFWLDVVATLSLIPDIPYILDPLLSLFQVQLYQIEVDVHTQSERDLIAQTYANRAINSIRFIRLVRIVKLYKYFAKNRQQEIKPSDQTGQMDPRSLGKRLSDITTRRVIIGVLLMLLLLPMLEVQKPDNATYYGLQQLFWVGRSQCSSSDEFYCNQTTEPYVSEEGWEDMVYRYSMLSETKEGDGQLYPLLWLRVSNLENQGKIQDIKQVKGYEQDEDCSGLKVDQDCSLRDKEMMLIVYAPQDCIDQQEEACQEVQVYARFDLREFVKQEAILNTYTTIFVGLILAATSMLFARDTQRIVVKPVNRMVNTVQQLAQEPIRTEELTRPPSRNSILEETFQKIGVLLQMSFGIRGSQIMSPVLADPQMDIFRSGTKTDSAIAIISIQNFPSIIDCLQEELLVFINKISKIIHTCAYRWEGVPCRNDMGEFLLIWPDNKATNALVALIKIYAEINRASDIFAYKSNNKIVTKFGDGYQLTLLMSLHIGWVIQGPVGSVQKIDPGYISPHIDQAEYILSLLDQYEIPLILSDIFYDSLTPKAQAACRKIDHVQTPFSESAMAIYTFDMTQDVPLPEAGKKTVVGQNLDIENRGLGDPVIVSDIEHFNYNTGDLFNLDNDILIMQRSVPPQFIQAYKEAIYSYIEGDWNVALAHLEVALNLKPGDGPSISLKKFMENFGGTAPEDWRGNRVFVREIFL